MPTILKKSLRIILWATGLLILLWLAIWTYVFINKKDLISKVNTSLTTKLKGSISIEDLEPSLLSTFPSVSLQLKNVLVRDTLYHIHHHDIFKAEKVLIRLQLFSLFTGSPKATKIIAEDASVYLFSDTLGNTNEYMLKSKPGEAASQSNTDISVPGIELKNVRFTLELQDRYKFFDFDIHRLSCNIDNGEEQLKLNVRLDLLVHQMAFNTSRGSFAKEKPIQGQIRLQYNKGKKELIFRDARLDVDDHPFVFSGNFGLAAAKPLYYLEIRSKKLSYQKGSRLVTENIGTRLDSFTVEKPIDVMAVIDGRLLPNRIPLVNIDVLLNGNSLTTIAGQFTEVTCKANFTNQLDKSKSKVDNNSGFLFTGFSGKLQNIPLSSDTTSIINLNHPELKTRIHADFNLDKLNDLMSGSTIEVLKGNCKADISFNGAMIVGDTAAASVNGSINISNASLKYLPRNLLLSDVKGSIVLDDKDVWVKELAAKSGSSEMVMNGEIRNFTSLIDKNPEKLLLNWNIESSRLNLNDFVSFVGKRNGVKSTSKMKKKTLRIFNQIDRMLNDCSVDIKIRAQKVTYKKFDATRVIAEGRMTGNEITLKRVQLEHAGGSLGFSGVLKQLSLSNSFSFRANMKDMDVKKVFTSFSNFSQDGITDQNIEGKLTASTDISGSITDKAELVKNSLKGNVDLLLRDGGLKNFEPLEKISQTAFKNRNFSDIRFADLQERMAINGSEIKLGKMEIQSNVMTMFVEGIYDLDKGTDISIQIPVSNLAKRDESFSPKNKGVNSRTGLSLYLRAKSGEDGKTKVTWDPFKKALKNARDASDSVDISKKSGELKPIKK